MAEFLFNVKDFTQKKVYDYAKEHGFRGEGIQKSNKTRTKWTMGDVKKCPYVTDSSSAKKGNEYPVKKQVNGRDPNLTTPEKKASPTENSNLLPTSKLIHAAKIANAIITHKETDMFVEHLGPVDGSERISNYKDWLEAKEPQSVHVGNKSMRNKIVIFSSFLDNLDVAQKIFAAVTNENCELLIKGAVSPDKRQSIIKRFNEDDSIPFIFCQTATGGAGINLQTANVVFLLDPVWSPALEWQARDRIWRIGSPHDAVYIYNFRISNTIEDEFVKLHEKKLEFWKKSISLVEDTVGLSAALSTPNSNSVKKLTRSEDIKKKFEFDMEVKNAGITATLKQHQFVGLRWMQRQERGENPAGPEIKGGILADDMGLGKTLQFLTLIKLDLMSSNTNKPTLAIMPPSVFDSWVGDCRKFISGMNKNNAVEKNKDMQVLVYHTDFHKLLPSLKHMNNKTNGKLLVLATYNALKTKKELLEINWRRLILDESQAINNKKNGFNMACKLNCDFKWSCSGTPMKNEMKDFLPHLKLIGADTTFTEHNMETEQGLNAVLLRRTKIGLKKTGEKLPCCFQKDVIMELSPEEQAAYEYALSGKHHLAKYTIGRQRTSVQKKESGKSKSEIEDSDEAKNIFLDDDPLLSFGKFTSP